MSPDAVKVALAATLANKWPRRPVYKTACSDDHERPASMVQVVSADPTPANAFLTRWDVTFLIVLWQELDSYGQADETTLNADQEAVLELLAGPYQVEDRHLLLTASAQGIDPDDGAAFVEVTTSWFDSPHASAHAPGQSEHLMEHFDGKIETKRER